MCRFDPQPVLSETAFPVDEFFFRFWIDAQTQLPVWMEMSFVPKGHPTRMTTVWDRFEWGVPLEAGLFQPQIPEGCEIADDPGGAPASLPPTDAAEAFARQTQAEPFLGDFDYLPLPDVSGLNLLGVDTGSANPTTRFANARDIWLAQDACIAKWPAYDNVKTLLQEELQSKIGFDTLDVDGLVAAGIALRNRFWAAGGCLSETAYPYAYVARLLMELAHERAPENPAITDQLVESIMTYEMYYWEDPAGGQPTWLIWGQHT